MTGFLKLMILSALNVNPSEFFDVIHSWLVSFLIRVAFVLGWTVLIVQFINYFGLKSIPLLFITHALASLFGHLVFRKIVAKYNPHSFLVVSTLITCLFSIGSFFAFNFSYLGFLISLFLIVSVFLTQLRIAKMLFVENLFSPIQSSRIFPIIESADTIGVICGGFLITILSSYFPVHLITLFIAFPLLLVIPIIVSFLNQTYKHPLLSALSHNTQSGETISFTHLRSSKLLFSISMIVFFQYLFFGILEIQYLEQVFQFAHESSHNLAFDLGVLHVIFGFCTVLFQIFVASRILSFTGIIHSMLISPVVLLSSILFLMFSPGFIPVLLSKFNFEISGALFNNAYHSSYYVFAHSSRAKIMEFLESCVKPIGLLIVGILASLVLHYDVSFIYLNTIAIVSLAFLAIGINSFDKSYKFVPLLHLRNSDNVQTLLDSLSILQQNPNAKNAHVLIELLNQRKFPVECLDAIFKIISQQGDLSCLNKIIHLQEAKKHPLRYILPAVNKFLIRYQGELRNLPFTNYHIRNIYNDLNMRELDDFTKAEIVTFMLVSNINLEFSNEQINQMQNCLTDKNIHLVFDVLNNVNDSYICSVLEPLVDLKKPILSYYVLQILSKFHWKFNYLMFIQKLANTKEDFTKCMALVLASKLSLSYPLESSRSNLLNLTNLMVLSPNKPSQDFLKYLFYKASLKSVKEFKTLVDLTQFTSYNSIIHSKLNSELHKILNSMKNEDLNKNDLKKLRDLYNVLGASKEFLLVNNLLSKS